MMKANEYGKFMRMIRKEKGENLNSMSEKLDVSIAFLSALEVGKKTIPLLYVDKITEIYGLTLEQKNELANAIDLSNSRIVIKLEDFDEEKKALSLAFARKIDEMSEEDVARLKELIGC